jgi:hypothetical protein
LVNHKATQITTHKYEFAKKMVLRVRIRPLIKSAGKIYATLSHSNDRKAFTTFKNNKKF